MGELCIAVDEAIFAVPEMTVGMSVIFLPE
jgi:hypothetical protein